MHLTQHLKIFISKHGSPETSVTFAVLCRLASLVGIMEKETGVGKLGGHGNSRRFDRHFFFPILRNERKEKD